MIKKSKLILLPILAMSIGMMTGCDGQALNNAISGVQSQIDGMQSDINDLKNQVKDLKDQIAKLEGEMNSKIAEVKADYEKKIADEEAEITKLQKSLDDLSKQFEADKKALGDDYNEKIGALQSTYEAKVQEIETNISTINTNITTLQSELAAQVTAIQNDYNGKINSLTERVSSLEEIKTHTVKFDTKGGNEITSQVVVHGEKVRKPEDPVRAGAVFEGWIYNDEPWFFYSSVVTEDMELVAAWELISYRVTFKNDDGTVLDTIDNVHYGDTVTYNGVTPIKPNQEEHYVYSFKGWDKDLVVTGDMEFIAQYDKEFAPFQEVFQDANGETIFSRYVLENDLSASITQNDKEINDVDGKVWFEAEECALTGEAHADENSVCHGGACIGWFEADNTLTLSFSSSRSFETVLTVAIARQDGKGSKIKNLFDIYVNDEKLELSDDLILENSNDWYSFDLIKFENIKIKNGDNTVHMVSKNPVNIDYFTIDAKTFNLEEHGISKPTKQNEGELKYCFHYWEQVSNVDNVVIYRPHFEEATIGLEFINNYVDIYHGSASEVFIPSWWDGQIINKIGKESFSFNTVVENVHLPETIVRIGYSAFFQAKNLTTINLPKSLKIMEYMVFQECPKLVNIELNEGLEEIHNHVFDRAGIKRVIIPSTVKKILDHAFCAIKADFIYIPASVGEIQYNAFYSDENNVNTVYCEREYRPSSYAGDWANNTSIVWGYKSEVEENGYKYAIFEIDGVEHAQVVAIDDSVTDFELPEKINGVTVDGMSAGIFTQSKTIKTVKYPSFMTKIYDRMFYQCSNLVSITVPDSVKEIGNCAFTDCARLASFEMPDSVESTGTAVFERCLNMKTVKISSSLKVLRDHIFANCNALKHLEIPEGVETTEFAIVEYCDNLRSVTFPSTIKSLGNQTFFYNWGIDSFFLKISPEKWASILETYNNDYDGIDRPTVYYYSETEPASPGNFWRYVEGVPTIW